MTDQHTEETTLSLQWYIPHRVLYIATRGSLSDQDSARANEMLMHYLSQSSKCVHLLIDVRRVRKLSTKLLHIEPSVLRHELMGWIVTVGMQQNPIVDFGISALSPKKRIRNHTCSTLQEALLFLKTIDFDLPDLSAEQPVPRA